MILQPLMAAWTQADADAVKAAIVELATGKRTVSISFTGMGRAQTFGIVQLPELEALLTRIERSLSGAPGYWLAITRTGL